MLDISEQHAFEVCTTFALKWLRALADGDYDRATSLIDVYQSAVPLRDCFSEEGQQGSPLLHPDKFFEWSIRFIGNDGKGLSLDFEVPFADDSYRPYEARFDLSRKGRKLRVGFKGFFAT
jgi:hypothetical protein